jgi:hypothetical protein
MTKLERMDDLISDFASRRAATRIRRLEAVDRLLSDFVDHRKRRRFKGAGSFNVLSLFRVEEAEQIHSGFLAWLLDADEAHGCGPLFMETLARLCGLPVDLRAGYYVRTEFSFHESIVDIMVARPGDFLMYIENKVWSPEGRDQLAREHRDMRRVGDSQHVPPDRQVGVFLTPAGLPPSTAGGTAWHTLSYADLAAAFAEVMPQELPVHRNSTFSFAISSLPVRLRLQWLAGTHGDGLHQALGDLGHRRQAL